VPLSTSLVNALRDWSCLTTLALNNREGVAQNGDAYAIAEKKKQLLLITLRRGLSDHVDA